MSNDPVVFTDEQRQLFQRVADLIRSRPQAFQAAGQELDRWADLPGDHEAGERTPYEIVQAATYAFLRDPPNHDALRPHEAEQQARRVLLVAWILTDPRPLVTKPSITELQAWAWGVAYLSDDPLVFTEGGNVDLDAPCEINRLYASMTLLDDRLAEWVTLAGDALPYLEQLPIAADAGRTAESPGDARPSRGVASPQELADERGVPVPDPVAVAVTMKVRDPKLTVRKAAEAVGIHYTVLQKDQTWQAAVYRLKQQAKGNVRPGSKSSDGQIETIADDDEEDSEE